MSQKQIDAWYYEDAAQGRAARAAAAAAIRLEAEGKKRAPVALEDASVFIFKMKDCKITALAETQPRGETGNYIMAHCGKPGDSAKCKQLLSVWDADATAKSEICQHKLMDDRFSELRK
jgi:hypothetical protein